jgi:hypothetical protein
MVLLSNRQEKQMDINATLTVGKSFTVGELWEAVWGCDGAGMYYWCRKLRKPNYQGIDLWKRVDGEITPNPQPVRIYDSIEEKSYVVEVDDLRRGYELALQAGQTHCGSYSLDTEDYDACFGDMIVQYAIFGKLIYG